MYARTTNEQNTRNYKHNDGDEDDTTKSLVIHTRQHTFFIASLRRKYRNNYGDADVLRTFSVQTRFTPA